MKPYLTDEGLEARCMRCDNASTGGNLRQLIGIGMKEVNDLEDSEFIGYKLENTVAEMFNDGRKKSRNSIYEILLFFLQLWHGPDISLTEDNVVLKWKVALPRQQLHSSAIPEAIPLGH